MSLFRVKERWSTLAGDAEEFEAMVCGNLDNVDDVDETKIALGSLSGILRVYKPSIPEYNATDLILEEDLGAPILQLRLGKFFLGTNHLGLAVLHPRKLVVYELTAEGIERNEGMSYYSLEKHYEHALGIEGEHFSACNMSSGNFGGGDGHDNIIVQSIDGKLQIFEASHLAFTRQFVDCLHPGPIEYVPALDAFVTVSTACEAQCFRYQVFVSSKTNIEEGASSSAGGGTTGQFGLGAVRAGIMEWRTMLGEHCVAILAGLFNGPDERSKVRSYNDNLIPEIVFVCEKALFLLDKSGSMLAQRRLEQTPVCACTYLAGSGMLDNVLVAMQEGTLHVYSELNLLWVARVDTVPVSLNVCSFGDEQGLITAVDDRGMLSVGFLGTRLATTLASSAASRDLDYNKVDEEHRQLLGIIRDRQAEVKTEPEDKLILRTQVVQELDLDRQGPETDIDMPDNLVTLAHALEGVRSAQLLKVCVRLFVAYTGAEAASDVYVSIAAPSFCHVVPKSCTLKKVKANSTPQLVRLYMYASKESLAQDLAAEVCATYMSQTGEPRVATHPFRIPIFLACGLRTATKQATYKFTLDTGDLPVQSATTLFQDLLVASHKAGVDVDEALGHTEQAIGLQLWACGANDADNAAFVSVLVSKNSGRYRVQSDSLSALAMAIPEVRLRLERILVPEGGNSVEGIVSCSDKLPLDALFVEAELHLAARKQLQEAYSELNDLSHLFRVIEKRMLTRFKDKNATPLSGLDSILEDTYGKVIGCGDKAEATQKELAMRHAEIEGVLRVLIELACMRLSLSSAHREALQGHLCLGLLAGTGSCSDDLEATGWEEMCEASLTHLLKTRLSKKPKSTVAAPKRMDMPDTIENLKQRVSMLFVKLEEGGRLL